MNHPKALTKDQIAERSRGESYQQMLDKESNPVPDSLRESTDTYLGSDNLSVDRYFSPEFQKLEEEKLWNRTWLAACRESELTQAGSYFVYDISKYSIVLTRTETGEIKGYYNACLHRGRQLRKDCGTAREFKCPFPWFSLEPGWRLPWRSLRVGLSAYREGNVYAAAGEGRYLGWLGVYQYGPGSAIACELSRHFAGTL